MNFRILITKMEQQLDEESKDTIPIISDLTSTGRVERKKYLKQTGKSLWMKNKGKKTNTLSIEVSTRSSDSWATFLGSNYQGSTVRYHATNLNFRYLWCSMLIVLHNYILFYKRKLLVIHFKVHKFILS